VNFAVLDKVGAQISPYGRLGSLVEQIVPAEVRKLAIGLMFPLLEKYNMPIKLVYVSANTVNSEDYRQSGAGHYLGFFY